MNKVFDVFLTEAIESNNLSLIMAVEWQELALGSLQKDDYAVFDGLLREKAKQA